MGIITNIYEAHIKYFGTIETVVETKSALFNSLPDTGTAFVNMDDEYIFNTSVLCNRVEYSFFKPVNYLVTHVVFSMLLIITLWGLADFQNVAILQGRSRHQERVR